jgi:hypothetical protein
MQAAHLDESTLNRYRVLVELSERGEGGERANAQKLVDKLRAKYPDIHAEAFRPEEPEADFTASGFHSSYRPTSGVNLRDIFDRVANQVRSGATWAAHAAYEAAQLEAAREAADATFEIRSKVLASGKWQVAAKIDLEQLDLISEDFTVIQLNVFADAVADMVREEVAEALGIYEDDE